jgi:hypothetical protein
MFIACNTRYVAFMGDEQGIFLKFQGTEKVTRKMIMERLGMKPYEWDSELYSYSSNFKPFKLFSKTMKDLFLNTDEQGYLIQEFEKWLNSKKDQLNFSWGSGGVSAW